MASPVNDEMDQAIAEASEGDAVKAIIFKGAVRTSRAGAYSIVVKFISQ
jgi:hypothetical protein